MALIETNWNPSRQQLRAFALMQFVFFCIVAWLVRSRGYEGHWVTAIVVSTLLVAVVGFCAPTWIRGVYVLWMGLAFPIGWTISHGLMLLIYYVVLTPIGLLMRIVGYDPMKRKLNPSLESYWVRRSPVRDRKQYFKQY